MMTDFRPFAGLASDEIAQAILERLDIIARSQPRLDANGRTQVVWSETAHNITTLTTLTTAAALTAFGGLIRDASAMPQHASNAGAMHLYNNIIVS